jgi:hypothetical protein
VLKCSRAVSHRYFVRSRLNGSSLAEESAQINIVAPSVVPTKLTWSDLQRIVLAQDAPEVVQFAAQIGKRLRIARLGPKQPRDSHPVLRPPAAGNQQAEQGKRSRRSGADTAHRSVEHSLCPEQPGD